MPAENLLAIEEIKKLRARFARSMDTKDWAGMKATIAPDCRFDAGQEANVEELWIGPDDIVANIRRNFVGCTSVHHAHTPEIELTSATTAKGLWAMQDVLRWAGPPPVELIGAGHYHETYVLRDGRWLIQSFKLTRLRVDVYNNADQAPPARPVDASKTTRAVLLREYGGPEKLGIDRCPPPMKFW
jgi:hypothetical protein